MTYKTKKEYKNLDYIPDLYLSTQNLNTIMEVLWPLAFQVICKVEKDKDNVHDFCVQLYEHIETCLKVHKNSDAPFTPFFVVYVKNLFSNFIRTQKRKRIAIGLYQNYESLNATYHFNYDKDIEESQEQKIKFLNHLENPYKTLIKLYLGIELQTKDLKYLLTKIDSPEKIYFFLESRRDRKAQAIKTAKSYEDQKAYLQTLIHKEENEEKLERLIDRKMKANSKDVQTLREITHLSNLFGVSKSTISRRLTAALRYLLHKKKHESFSI